MKKIGITCVFLIVALIPLPVSAADFYVSPQGKDTWTGTTAEPNAKKTDGPFATLTRARDAVRTLKKTDPKKDLTVQIRGGDYALTETLTFGLQDSGTDNSTITYEAYPDEKPIFHSDIKIENWKKLQSPLSHLPEESKNKVWVADLSQLENLPARFLTLYDDSGLLPRARSKGFIPSPVKKNGRNSFRTPSGMVRNWSNLEDIELVIRPHHAWVVNILPITSVNVEKQFATTSIPATYSMSKLHYLPEKESAWIENTIDSLDQPGEWVLNSKEGKLYLWPRTDAAPKNIRLPLLQEYFLVEGKIDEKGPKDIPVRNLTFRGLTFTRGESYRINESDKGLQHDWEMHDKPTALVRLRGSEVCAIENCHFLHSGGAAIRSDLHSQKNKIQHNHIEHIGGTGILISGYGPGTKDLSHHNLVYNNHIHHTGTIYAHSPGIFLWQSGENRVANNLIHHTPYSGIIISGVMTQFFSKNGDSRELVRTIRRHEVPRKKGKITLEDIRPFLHSHDNVIERNEIHHAMQQLNDGNGIYIRGCGAGNIIRQNYIHDLLADTVMQSSIRTDGGQRDTLITENIIFRCNSQGMQIKLNNRVINNIIADIRPTHHKGELRTPTYFKLYEGPMTGGAYQKNILYHLSDSEATFYQEIKNYRVPIGAYAKDADTHSNIYFSQQSPSLAKANLKKKKREGVDKNSLASDPLFRNPDEGDFRLQAESPALKLGFKPIDQSKIGLRK